MKLYDKNPTANSLVRIISDALLYECALARQTRYGTQSRSLDYFLLVNTCTEYGHLCYSSKIILGYSMNDAIAELQALEGMVPQHADELSWRLKEYSHSRSQAIRSDILRAAHTCLRTSSSNHENMG